MIVDFSVGESCRTGPAADARLADVDTLQANLHGPVACEQVRHVVPHLAIDVVDTAIGKTESSAADLLQKERSNSLAIERALRVVADAGVGEEIGEVVPQPEL